MPDLQLHGVRCPARLDVLTRRPERMVVEDQPERFGLPDEAGAGGQPRPVMAGEHGHPIFEGLELGGDRVRMLGLDLDRTDVGVEAEHPHTIAAKLQALEYRMA